jgi:hypothetical protein
VWGVAQQPGAEPGMSWSILVRYVCRVVRSYEAVQCCALLHMCCISTLLWMRGKGAAGLVCTTGQTWALLCVGVRSIQVFCIIKTSGII